MRSVSILRTGAVPVCALFLSAGCVPPQTGSGSNSGDLLSSLLPNSGSNSGQQVLAATAPRPAPAPVVNETEPNDDIAHANPVTVDGSVQLVGTMAAGANFEDRDIFDLGDAAPNDRIQADLVMNAGSDIVFGLFDDQQHVVGYIDPSSTSAGPSRMDVVLQETTTHLYAVVSTRSSSTAARNYTVKLSIARGLGVPNVLSQILVLDFLGGSQVRVAQRQAVDIPAFDAARIDPKYSGYTNTIINNVYQLVAESYAGLGMNVYLASDPNIPSAPRSTIYFGTYDSRLLGLADNVDPYNSNENQSAVVFTDTFSVFKPLSPDVQGISQVLANVASHEAGHLVGLRHTADPKDLMDTTATARQMMLPQTFRDADLNGSVISFGLQDAPMLLSWTLGGVLSSPAPNASKLAARAKAIEIASKGVDFYIPRWQLMSCSCPNCAAEPEATPAGQ